MANIHKENASQIYKKRKKQICEVCFQPPTKDNPLESSHIIGFKIGIVNFVLTPDFLDKD